MRFIIILFFILIALITGCKKETFKSYYSNFFSIHFIKGEKDYQDYWVDSKFISGDTIAFRIESHKILVEYHKLEPIEESTIEFSCNKDFILNDDTIKSKENLFHHLRQVEKEMLSFSEIKQTNGGPSYYHIIIHNSNKSSFKIPNGYYVFYFSSKTKEGFLINDSTLIKYNN